MMSELLTKSVDLAEKRGIRKQCKNCAQHGRISKMILDKQENWYKCQKCKYVQPVDTNVPLWWNHCPNFWRDGNSVKLIKVFKNIHQFFRCAYLRKKFHVIPFTTWCLYPKLITTDQKGIIKIKCAKCGHIYTGA